MLKKKKWIIIAILVIILILLLFFRFGGEILVAQDDIEDIDQSITVLLMGSVADRALGAADLYNDGKAQEILMVRSYITGRDILEERGITIPGDAKQSEHVLTESGVSDEDIKILPGDAESTKDEALAIADYLAERPDIDEILLVTSKYHSYRAKLIFNKALKELDVEVYSVPTPYDPYEAKGWYKDREDIQRVATEYMKLAHYFFLEQFTMKQIEGTNSD